MLKRLFTYKNCTLYKYEGFLNNKINLTRPTKKIISQIKDNFIEKKKFLNRTDDDNYCYLTKDKNNIIAYHWIKISNEVPLYFNLNYNLKKKNLIIWDCKTKNEFRKKSFYKKGIVEILSLKKYKKIDKFIVIDNKNDYLLNTIENIGFKKVRKFTCVKFLNYAVRLP